MAKILFIEDEAVLQKTFTDFLRKNGHEVISAFDGQQGLDLVRSQRPDLVLLDLILPRLHGLDLLSAMRKDEAIGKIPVIVLTNLETAEGVEKAIELGARAYLVKTNYTPQEVLEKIESALKEQ